jgi:hypothetical protein
MHFFHSYFDQQLLSVVECSVPQTQHSFIVLLFVLIYLLTFILYQYNKTSEFPSLATVYA